MKPQHHNLTNAYDNLLFWIILKITIMVKQILNNDIELLNSKLASLEQFIQSDEFNKLDKIDIDLYYQLKTCYQDARKTIQEILED